MTVLKTLHINVVELHQIFVMTIFILILYNSVVCLIYSLGTIKLEKAIDPYLLKSKSR